MCSVRLDTTLADLYREHGIKGPFIVTTHCVFGHMDLHPEFPRELMYPEDEEPVPYSNDKQEIARLRKVILGLKPVRRAVGLGDMDVLFFEPNVTATGMERALNQLPPEQRHRPRFIDLEGGQVFEKLLDLTKGQKLHFWRPQAWMKDHECLVDPQLAYDINSKEYLITSGIRTPPSTLMPLDEASLATLDEHPLPFVIKLCRAGCGFGTFIVTTEQRRLETRSALILLQQRGVRNFILSAYVDLVEDLSVHFVVGPDNREDPHIVGVTVQTLTATGKWTGGYIDYSAQERLHDYVRATVSDTTARLPKEFVGWAGVDIVVDKDGEQWVVDLNARFTGSMPICFMSGHFLKDRGLPLAQFGAFEYSGGVEDVYDLLGELVKSGEAIVTATAVIDPGQNMADIAWGGKNASDLERRLNLIRSRLARV
ncbi:uncharacterized protein E0L32_007644 [Thyridium curvatum]|uniref:ATP-grasp domain-containing protein n=1 Tax=Thyridium curvatum TaxID=1093900 RepID=A0A507ALY6_9PEZI|nr:uncharacterized protein E0L32_007644 [Thyridium curvatum]TPX11665.1 hypothetical protein E0L32_007644 [Thyridium curvatum]